MAKATAARGSPEEARELSRDPSLPPQTLHDSRGAGCGDEEASTGPPRELAVEAEACRGPLHAQPRMAEWFTRQSHAKESCGSREPGDDDAANGAHNTAEEARRGRYSRAARETRQGCPCCGACNLHSLQPFVRPGKEATSRRLQSSLRSYNRKPKTNPRKQKRNLPKNKKKTEAELQRTL